MRKSIYLGYNDIAKQPLQHNFPGGRLFGEFNHLLFTEKASHLTPSDFFFSWRDNLLVGLDLIIHEVYFSRSHTTTHHSR